MTFHLHVNVNDGLLPPCPTLAAAVAVGPVPLVATEDEVVETSPVA